MTAMAARRLVVCPACGRPQFPTQAGCVGCQAALPDTPATAQELKAGRDQVLEAYEPFLEASFGRGHRLLLSHKRLEWHAGRGAPMRVELSRLTGASLQSRPVYEALLISAICVLVDLGLPWPYVGGALGLVALLAVMACFNQRRFALVLRSGDRTAHMVLGVGTARSPIARAVKSAWATFAEELAQLGVAVDR